MSKGRGTKVRIRRVCCQSPSIALSSDTFSKAAHRDVCNATAKRSKDSDLGRGIQPYFGTMRQDAALSATLCHPDVVSTSDTCQSGDPINTICSPTLASSDDGAVLVWQATCFLPCAMRNHMSQADTDAHRGQQLDMPDRGTAALELQAVLSLRLPSFYRDALRLLGNAADAEDAVQEALLAAYKHIGQFRGQSQMSTWVATIVRACQPMFVVCFTAQHSRSVSSANAE
jgi:hypothetical protein